MAKILRGRWVGGGVGVLVALALVAGGASSVNAQDSGIGIALGTVPEAVQVEDLNGNVVDLGDYIGKTPTLLEFWATWCPVCSALEPRMEVAHRTYGDRVAFLIIGVGVSQTPRQIRRHLEDHDLPGRFLFDAKGAAVRAFKAPTTSYIVILDATGKVTYTGSGEDQPISEALRRVVEAG